VLVLISTILAIAAPSLRSFVHGRQTSDAAAHMLALTRLARSQAVALGCVYRLNIDTEEGTYWLTRQEVGAFVEIEGDQGRRHLLPVGVSVAVESPTAAESPTGAGSPTASESVWSIQFYPDGRSDVATIALASGEGEVLCVTCPSASERFRVVSLAEGERL